MVRLLGNLSHSYGLLIHENSQICNWPENSDSNNRPSVYITDHLFLSDHKLKDCKPLHLENQDFSANTKVFRKLLPILLNTPLLKFFRNGIFNF